MNQIIMVMLPTQLFAVVAAQLMASDKELSAEAAIEKAIGLIALADVRSSSNALKDAIDKLDPDFMEEQLAKQRAAQGGLVVPGPSAPMEFLKQRNRKA